MSKTAEAAPVPAMPYVHTSALRGEVVRICRFTCVRGSFAESGGYCKGAAHRARRTVATLVAGNWFGRAELVAEARSELAGLWALAAPMGSVAGK